MNDSKKKATRNKTLKEDASAVKSMACSASGDRDFAVVAIKALVASLTKRGRSQDAQALWLAFLDTRSMSFTPISQS